MIDDIFTPREEDDALAAEYVLGVLDLQALRAAEQRLRNDPDFAALVQGWENHFAGLNDGFDEVTPPDLLPQIEARLFPQAAKPVKRGWFSGLLAGSLSAVTALGVAAFFLLTPPAPDVVAMLSTEDHSISYLAEFTQGEITVTRTAGHAAPAGQVHELWIISPGSAPVSMGLLADKPLHMEYPLPPKGWVLAVSVEPEGGSPTGSPTGPVVMTAEIGA